MKTFVGFFNGHSHAWMIPRASISTCKQIISAHIFLGATDWTILNPIKSYKTYNLLPYKIIRFRRRLSLVQSVAPRQIRAEIICLRVDLLALGVIHACEWPLKTPTKVFIYRFQGIFSANVFSELAVYTKSKMIIFTSGPLRFHFFR